MHIFVFLHKVHLFLYYRVEQTDSSVFYELVQYLAVIERDYRRTMDYFRLSCCQGRMCIIGHLFLKESLDRPCQRIKSMHDDFEDLLNDLVRLMDFAFGKPKVIFL